MALVVGLVVGALTPGRASAQVPDHPQNLQVLPDTLSGRQVVAIMRDVAGGLGVRCVYCHVGTNPADLSSIDFATDEKPEKRVAREMLRMVGSINSDLIPRAVAERPERSDPVEVTCTTCHRGNARPVFIEDVLAERLEDEGVDGAIALYRDLREQYYGGYQYDFRSGPLTSLAETLSLQDRFDEALAFARLAVEYNPDDYSALYGLGQTQERAGMVDEAIQSMTRALDVAPDGFKAFFRREIRRLRGGD